MADHLTLTLGGAGYKAYKCTWEGGRDGGREGRRVAPFPSLYAPSPFARKFTHFSHFFPVPHPSLPPFLLLYTDVPYGLVGQVLPYLIRRAQENSDMLGGVGKELGLIRTELWRRVFG